MIDCIMNEQDLDIDIDLEKPEKKDNCFNILFNWMINRELKYLRC